MSGKCYSSREILQIMPDTKNFYACFEDENGAYEVPLVGWALIRIPDEDGGSSSTIVCGLIFDDESTEAYPIMDDSYGFVRYNK